MGLMEYYTQTERIIAEANKIDQKEYQNFKELLKDYESMSTPDFIILRSAQKAYPDIFEQVERENNIKFNKLSDRNIPILDEKDNDKEEAIFVNLAKLLEEKMASDYSIEFKGTFFPYIYYDQIPTKREICYKLIIGMSMDTYDAERFLIVCNQSMLSVKSPADFVFLLFKDQVSKFDWNAYEELMDEYEKRRWTNVKERMENHHINPAYVPGGTALLIATLEEWTGAGQPDESDKIVVSAEDVIEFLLVHDNLFTIKSYKTEQALKKDHGQYRDGFYYNRYDPLEIIARYMYLFYKDRFGYSLSKKNSDGTINIPSLVSMISDYHLDNLFGEHPSVFFENYQRRIRCILRSVKENMESQRNLERADALYFGFFFMLDYLLIFTDDERANRNSIKKKVESLNSNSIHIKKITVKLDNMIKHHVENPFNDFKDLFSTYLEMFGFEHSELYLSVPIERWFLIRIIMEYNALMQK